MKNKYFIGFVASFFIASAFSAFAQDTLRVDTLYHIQATPVNVSPYRARIDIRGFVSHFVLDQRYGGNIADTSICVAYAFQIPGSSPPEPIWDVPPSPITSAMLEPGSDSSFTWHIYLGPGSRTGTFNGWVELCHYEGGFYGPSWWWQWITFDICSYQYSIVAAPGEIDSFPVQFDFCDAKYDTLPTNYVVGFEDTLYIKIEVPPPESVAPYSRCALVCLESQDDTFYYDIPVDTNNTSMAKGKVFPAKTLGGDTQILHGFSTVHGYVFKGDSIYGEDWIDAGQLFIIVRGTTPGTLSNSFLSTNQLEFEAVTRSHSGITVTPSNNSIIWGTIALNDTSGSLSPDSGRGRIFHSIPNPKSAPYTRGEALAYKCSCSVNYPGVGAQDWVILRQDERDQLIQEYIDTRKLRLPTREEMRLSVGSYMFSDDELKSSDYNYFLTSEDLLQGLIFTELDFGHELVVHQYGDEYRAYLSPNRLFLTKPQGGQGQPTYWEGDSTGAESRHIYGEAIDINVLDWDYDGMFRDDWDSLAFYMRLNGVKPVDMADTTYIHAEDSSAVYSSLITISISPKSIKPGLGPEVSATPYIVKKCSIDVQINPLLSPFTGNVLLRVEEVPLSGGHNHYSRPIKRYPEISLVPHDSLNNCNGHFKTIYEDYCIYGGKNRFIAYYQDGSRLYYSEDTLTISSPGLDEFPKDTTWRWTGKTEAHPNNHFIDTLWTGRLNRIISEFYRKCREDTTLTEDKTLWINDISLINGGLFDIGPRPTHPEYRFWYPPHGWHRGGYGVDIRYADFDTSDVYCKHLKDVCDEIGRRECFVEGDHIHCYLCTRRERRWP
jgi:hypothetical protein